jgi:hypothetical protein
MAYNKVSMGNAHDFTKTAEVEGKLVNVKADVGPNHSMLYVLEPIAGGEMISVWGSTTLDNKMSVIKIGERIRIVYLGQVPSPNRPGKFYKNFEVFLWSDEGKG